MPWLERKFPSRGQASLVTVVRQNSLWDSLKGSGFVLLVFLSPGSPVTPGASPSTQETLPWASTSSSRRQGHVRTQAVTVYWVFGLNGQVFTFSENSLALTSIGNFAVLYCVIGPFILMISWKSCFNFWQTWWKAARSFHPASLAVRLNLCRAFKAIAKLFQSFSQR